MRELNSRRYEFRNSLSLGGDSRAIFREGGFFAHMRGVFVELVTRGVTSKRAWLEVLEA